MEPRRYVDAGGMGDGVSVLMGGGITRGLDVGLYLFQKIGEMEMAKQAMSVMGYERRKE